MARALGVVCVVFGRVPMTEAARRAKALGFDHVDVVGAPVDDLALPIGDRLAFPGPRAECTSPAPRKATGAWDDAVATYRKIANARIEPWPGSILDSIGACEDMLAAVPGLRLTVDTGHVACWGEDPIALLPHAGHVQLRQARQGEPQTIEGDVDFARLLRRLDEIDYRGRLSVEYFDLPEMGWPLADPVAYALALAERIRSLG